MLTIETERRVARFFLEILKHERKCQLSKAELVSSPFFNAYQCFNLLHKAEGSNSSNEVSAYSIVAFLKANKTHCTLTEASSLILFYDPEMSGVLSYANFVNFIMNTRETPSMQSVQFNITNTSTNSSLPEAAHQLFMNVLLDEIELLRGCQGAVNEMKNRYDYDVNDLFAAITSGKNISVSSMRLFLIRNGLCLDEDEIGMIVNRLSLHKNGRVSLMEFKRVCEEAFVGDVMRNMKEMMMKLPGGDVGFGFEKERKGRIGVVDGNGNIKRNEGDNEVGMRHNLINEFNDDAQSGNLVLKEKEGQCTRNVIERNELNNNNNYNSNNSVVLHTNNSSFLNNKSHCSNCSSSYPPLQHQTQQPPLQHEETLILNFFKTILNAEISIEKSKCELALRSDFNIEDAFTIFHSASSSSQASSLSSPYLTSSDVLFGLSSLSLPEINVPLLMNRFSSFKPTNANSTLFFDNFFDMLVPFTKEYRSMIEVRSEMPYEPKYNKSDIFLSSTLMYLQSTCRRSYHRCTLRSESLFR